MTPGKYPPQVLSFSEVSNPPTAQSHENDYFSEWKTYLRHEISKEINSSKYRKERFAFYTENIVKCVFHICMSLKQPPDVRYLAIDIFDRFLVQHFFDVVKSFEKIDVLDSGSWQIVNDRLLQQSPLRILNSIWLAVKYCCSYSTISAPAIEEIIKHLGDSFPYSKKNILKSEGRVFKTLNFTIPSKTPLTYLEMFFEEFKIQENLESGICRQKFFKNCVSVLDLAIIHHQKIYSDSKEFSLRNFEGSSKVTTSTKTLKGNFMTLAASVIFVASILEDSTREIPQRILQCVSAFEECSASDVRALGRRLIRIILLYEYRK